MGQGSITYIPRQRSGFQEFVDIASPYLQVAFQNYMKQKLDTQQSQQATQQAQQMFPQAFTQSLNPQGEAKYDFSMIDPATREASRQDLMPSIPQQYKQTAFNPKGAKSIPAGMKIPLGAGMEYNAPQPDLFTQLQNYQNLKGTGILPEGMDITGISGKNVQLGTDIPKQKFEAEQTEKQLALQEKSDFIVSQAQDSLNSIQEAKKGVDAGYFGMYGVIPAIPGTAKYTWQQNMDKILAGKMIDLMTEMKSASKTGATGFGQLSEKEGQILRDASTALKRGLAPDKAKEYLNNMEKVLKKVIQKRSGQGDLSQISDEELRRIASGS